MPIQKHISKSIQTAIQILIDFVAPSHGVTQLSAQAWENAKAVLIIRLHRNGIVFNFHGGQGVLISRVDSEIKGHSWSLPVLMNYEGAGVGVDVGFETTDMIVLFYDMKTVFQLLVNPREVEVINASVKLGHFIRDNDKVLLGQEPLFPETKSAILYSKTEGVYGGVVIEFDKLSLNCNGNATIYGEAFDPYTTLTGWVTTAADDDHEQPEFRFLEDILKAIDRNSTELLDHLISTSPVEAQL